MHIVKQFVFPVAQSPVGTFVQTLSLDELIRFHALGSCAGDQVVLEASAHTWTGASTTLQRVFQLETLEETSLRITSNCEELSKEVIHSAIELQRVATSFSNAQGSRIGRFTRGSRQCVSRSSQGCNAIDDRRNTKTFLHREPVAWRSR